MSLLWVHAAISGPHQIGKQPFLRFGDWPEDEQSVNHAEGWKEFGVSVYDLHPHTNEPMDPDPHWDHPGAEWANHSRQERMRDWDRGRQDAYVVHGDVEGIGHDGEPLLRNVEHARDWEGPARHVPHWNMTRDREGTWHTPECDQDWDCTCPQDDR